MLYSQLYAFQKSLSFDGAANLIMLLDGCNERTSNKSLPRGTKRSHVATWRMLHMVVVHDGLLGKMC